jgi:hypothetical protein
MKPFIIPILMWAYILSAVLAKGLWASVYETLIKNLDLSPNQTWLLLMVINGLVAIIGLPYALKFVIRRREGQPLSPGERVAFYLCVVAIFRCSYVTIGAWVQKSEEISAAIKEFGDEEQKVFAAGQTSDGVYSNSNIGISIAIPQNWRLLSLNEIRREKATGAAQISKNNPSAAKALTAPRPGVYALLGLRKHSESDTGYNSSLYVAAYDKKTIALESGADTLESYASSYKNVAGPYELKSGPLRKNLGKTLGYHVHIDAYFPPLTVQQHVYLAETKQYYLCLAVSVVDQEDFQTLKKTISTFSIRDLSSPMPNSH